MRTIAPESCAKTIRTCLPSFRSPLPHTRRCWQLRAKDIFHVQNTKPPNPYSPKRVANRNLRRPPSNRVRGKVLRPNRPSLGDLDGARALPPTRQPQIKYMMGPRTLTKTQTTTTQHVTAPLHRVTWEQSSGAEESPSLIVGVCQNLTLHIPIHPTTFELQLSLFWGDSVVRRRAER